jgi:hypothetical protein
MGGQFKNKLKVFRQEIRTDEDKAVLTSFGTLELAVEVTSREDMT